jgi:hypothetical protein
MTLGQAPAAAADAPLTTAAPAEAEDPAPPTPTAPIPYQPQSIRPFEMGAAIPDGPVAYDPSASDRIPDAPVMLESYRRSYEGPPDSREVAYQAGVQRNFNAQQVRMGPLDGAWTVRTRTGGAFMALQLHDPGRPDSEIEGAWRTLVRTPEGSRSGFLQSVSREGQTLVIRWYDRDQTGNMSVMRLIPGADGRWSGAIEARDVEIPVTMGR